MVRIVGMGAAMWILAALAGPATAQEIPQEAIEQAANAHAAFQVKGGLAGVTMGITECWENARKLATFQAAVYCSAYNFTAANFDRGAMSLLKVEPTLKMADANREARQALITAGVSEQRVPAMMDEIRRRVIEATNQRFSDTKESKPAQASKPVRAPNPERNAEAVQVKAVTDFVDAKCPTWKANRERLPFLMRSFGVSSTHLRTKENIWAVSLYTKMFNDRPETACSMLGDQYGPGGSKIPDLIEPR